MNAISRRSGLMMPLFLALLGSATAFAAQAAYKFTTIDYPGAQSTQFWGINNSGVIVGQAFVGSDPAISFTYDPKKNVFTVLPNVPTALSTGASGINNQGIVTGSVSDANTASGFVLSKGAFSFFTHPGYPYTEGRALGSTGLVTGYATDSTFTSSIGFIYDPTNDTFVDFLPSLQTIAQGINGSRNVVGSTRQLAGAVCSTCPGPRYYGFLRDSGGAIRYFLVNGQDTRGRGITDSGVIAGSVNTGTGEKGFVLTLNGTAPFQALTVPDVSLLAVPGAASTIVEGINEPGTVVGYTTDTGGYNHGFIATRK